MSMQLRNRWQRLPVRTRSVLDVLITLLFVVAAMFLARGPHWLALSIAGFAALLVIAVALRRR